MMVHREPSLPVTISGGGDMGVSLGGGGRIGVASTASRGWGPVSVTCLGLIGVELDTRLMTSVPGAVLSSSREHGWMVVPNFLCLGFTLTGVPVMWLLTAPGLSITFVNTGLFSPALRV